MFTKTKKKVNVFVRLLEGTEIVVPCQALHIQKDIFEILKNNSLDMEDKTSIWQFFPGDLVKCEMRNGLYFAKELLSSTFPDREIHHLIFMLVESLGQIEYEYLKKYTSALKDLCVRKDILQLEHPIVLNWRRNNCS